jgi:hypothetical protein
MMAAQQDGELKEVNSRIIENPKVSLEFAVFLPRPPFSGSGRVATSSSSYWQETLVTATLDTPGGPQEMTQGIVGSLRK